MVKCNLEIVGLSNQQFTFYLFCKISKFRAAKLIPWNGLI